MRLLTSVGALLLFGVIKVKGTFESLPSFRDPKEASPNLAEGKELSIKSDHDKRQAKRAPAPFNIVAPFPDTSGLENQFWHMFADGLNIVEAGVYWSQQPDEPNLQYIFENANNVLVQQRLKALLSFFSQTVSPGTAIYLDESTYLTPDVGLPAYCQNSAPSGLPAPSNPGYAVWAENVIVLCPAFYQLPTWPTDCWSVSQGGFFITLLAQLPTVMGFSAAIAADAGVEYGVTVIHIEPPSERVDTADAYRLYSWQSRIRCEGGMPPGLG